MIKVCVICGKEFESKYATAKYCSNECRKKWHIAIVKKYREENKEKIKAAKKKYREKNREKINAIAKKYREENREKINAIVKKYREENREKVNAIQKKYREENREKINKQSLEYYYNHPERKKVLRKISRDRYYKNHEENLIKISTDEVRKKSIERAIEWRNNNRERFRKIALKSYYRGKIRKAEKEKKNIEVIESGIETIGVKWYPDKKKFRARLGQTTVGWYNYYDDAVKARERAERRYMAEQPKQECILCGSSFRLRPRDKRDRQICHSEECEKMWKSYKMAITGFKRGKRKSEPIIDEYKIEKRNRNE